MKRQDTATPDTMTEIRETLDTLTAGLLELNDQQYETYKKLWFEFHSDFYNAIDKERAARKRRENATT